MNIPPSTLHNQFVSALRLWPFIPSVERTYRLPSMLLFAVGSRETNLINEIGDGGHGHGVWQLDDRSHDIPAGFMTDVRTQARVAATMLRNLYSLFDDWHCALAAYNAGAGTVRYNKSHGLSVDTGTAGNDYSTDTFQRMQSLQRAEGTSMARTLTNDDVAAIAAAVWAHRYEMTIYTGQKETERMDTWLANADNHASEAVSLLKRR